MSEHQKKQLLQRLPPRDIFQLLPFRVDPEAAADIDAVILFKFVPPPGAAAAPAPAAPAAAAAAAAAEQRDAQKEPAQAAASPETSNSADAPPQQQQLLQQEQLQQLQQQQQMQQQQVRRRQQQQQLHCVHFRRGIVFTRDECERAADVEVETTEAAWRSFLTKETGLIAAAARGDFRVKGPLLLLVKCLASIELDMD
ncbi:hypothetical protein ETH_00012615 [Eimeria tenella]|uniref:SCP2 domain-containing protein n=1 Tax=Eimeria tenella TaxID=5802 RepID=U6L4S1_EIMTE|nr:hypothetical protein ETH_00012615 [Eimeria tenella]CDJ43589.1 hypothetical protein ETH_00012615 [Eimeria tenella]|eukprot:XP_013234339.1 hypothetical protein ETH_00012615 [Eimeria tenella]